MTDFIITLILTVLLIVMVLNLGVMLLWIERKGSALLQDRIGAYRNAVFGGLRVNLGSVSTMIGGECDR